MQTHPLDEFRLLGAALIALAVALGGAGAAAGLVAAEHMAAAAALCGPANGHCSLCLAADSLLIAAVGAAGVGLRFSLKSRLATQRAA